MVYVRFVAAILCSSLLSAYVSAAPVVGKVVLAGDSLTVGITAGDNEGYADEFQTLYANSAVVGRPGLNAENFVREDVSPGSGITYAEQVVDLNPDVIVMMLGINDARSTSNVTGSYTNFRNRLGDASNDVAFDIFDTSTASRVIVLSILPVTESGAAATNQRIDGTGGADSTDVSFGYNPWLQEEVAQRNSDSDVSPVYEYVDLNSGFNTALLQSDGLHLNAAGQAWLASAVLAQVTAVPEPSGFLAVSFVALLSGLVTRRARLLASIG